MSDNRDSGLLGGLILGAGFVAIFYYTIAAPIYVARRWGIHGLAWLAAALTWLFAFLIPAEDKWLSALDTQGWGTINSIAALLHHLARWPWAWIAAGLSAFAIVLTLFPEIRHPGSPTPGDAQADSGTPSSREGA